MFTGLVEGVGTLTRRERRGPGFRMTVGTDLGPIELGESVSVNGVCLTAAALGGGWFEVDLSEESAQKSNLGRVLLGGSVNLERALAMGGRLGGHFVSGHIDAVVRVRTMASVGDARRVELELPDAARAFLAPKGSVALDGVSLTVNDVHPGSFTVMVIPHTLRATTLVDLAPGRELNLEVDLLARYVVACLRSAPGHARLDQGETPDRDRGLIEALKHSGMM